MLDEFIKLSQRGDALWISDVRKAFAAEPDAYRAVIRLECLDAAGLRLPPPPLEKRGRTGLSRRISHRPHFQHSLVLQRPRAARLS